jgi:hypothetical protein
VIGDDVRRHRSNLVGLVIQGRDGGNLHLVLLAASVTLKAFAAMRLRIPFMSSRPRPCDLSAH